MKHSVYLTIILTGLAFSLLSACASQMQTTLYEETPYLHIPSDLTFQGITDTYAIPPKSWHHGSLKKPSMLPPGMKTN